MKVSIIIPACNEEKYISDILRFIRANTRRENIEEIIIVEMFNRPNLVKVAERAHAKLFLAINPDFCFGLEAGAFEATGAVLYFIKPGCFPPPDFDERILHAVKTKYLTGGFRIRTESRNYLQRILCMLTNCGSLRLLIGNSSFFMTRRLYHRIGGFRRKGNWCTTSELISKAIRFSRFKVLSDYVTINSQQ